MKKSFFVLLLTALLIQSGISQDKQDWKFLHPLPQSNNLRVVQTIDANNWVAGGANGTFMRTTNAGANWYFHHFAGRVNPQTLASTQLYSIYFFNSNTGFVGADQASLLKTTNGGLTFDSTVLGVPYNQRVSAIWFANSLTGYVATGSQSSVNGYVVKTTDGGQSWSTVYNTSSTTITYLTGTDASNIYVSGFNGDIFKSTNGGTNWTSVSNSGFYFYHITFLDANTGFACGGYGKVKRTTNAGTTWDSVNTPTADWSLFQVKTVSATEIYAVGDPSFLYKSTNLGNTWSSLPISVPNVLPYIWYSIDKTGLMLVMSGDYGLIAKSSDGGVTWLSNNTQYNTQIMNDIESLPGTGKIWFAGRPSPSGKQVMYSSNNGNNWITYGTGSNEEFFAISMINENTGYVSANNSKVFKTTNGGQNFVMMTQPSGSNYSLYSMDFINENTGWVCVNYSTVAAGNVFKTTDGGQNWTQYNLAATNPGSIFSCDFVNANTGFVSLNSSNKPVYRTTDGGVTWTPYTTSLTGIIYQVSAVDANVVYAVTSAGTNRVAKSTNGGVNWTGIPIPVAADYRSINFKDANTGYICGNSTTAISRTSDGGNTWTFQNAHVVTLGRVHVNSGDTAFVCGGYTSILRAAGSVLTGVHYNGYQVPDGFELKQNYPNPFNPVTTIEFALPRQGNVTVKVFDIAGREYYTDIRNMMLNKGTFKMSFDGSRLSSGVYFYSLIVDGARIAANKMVLMK